MSCSHVLRHSAGGSHHSIHYMWSFQQQLRDKLCDCGYFVNAGLLDGELLFIIHVHLTETCCLQDVRFFPWYSRRLFYKAISWSPARLLSPRKARDLEYIRHMQHDWCRPRMWQGGCWWDCGGGMRSLMKAATGDLRPLKRCRPHESSHKHFTIGFAAATMPRRAVLWSLPCDIRMPSAVQVLAMGDLPALKRRAVPCRVSVLSTAETPHASGGHCM